MSKWRWRWLACALLCVAQGAAAGTWNGEAEFKSGQSATYTYTSADGTTGDSDGFKVTEGEVLVCNDPNTSASGSGGGVISVRRCIGGPKPSSNPENVCVTTGGAQSGTSGLDGTEGDAFTQNTCVRYGVGFYYIDIVSACGGTCLVSIDHWRIR